MSTAYWNTLLISAFLIPVAAVLTAIPGSRLQPGPVVRRATSGKRRRSARVPLLGSLADRLLAHVPAMLAVLLSLASVALVVIAFLHQELRDEGSWTWSYLGEVSSFYDSHGAALGIVYLATPSMLLSVLAILLTPPDFLGNRKLPNVRSVERSLWRLRRWGARTCAMGTGIALVFMIMWLPSLIDLILAVLRLPDVN